MNNFDILNEIIEMLSVKDIIYLAQTNKQMHHYIFKMNESKIYCSILKKYHINTKYLYNYELECLVYSEMSILKYRHNMSNELIKNIMIGYYTSDLVITCLKNLEYKLNGYFLKFPD